MIVKTKNILCNIKPEKAKLKSRRQYSSDKKKVEEYFKCSEKKTTRFSPFFLFFPSDRMEKKMFNVRRRSHRKLNVR